LGGKRNGRFRVEIGIRGRSFRDLGRGTTLPFWVMAWTPPPPDGIDVRKWVVPINKARRGATRRRDQHVHVSNKSRQRWYVSERAASYQVRRD
jgi:hypothetical protein